jgi:hypothetical protein
MKAHALARADVRVLLHELKHGILVVTNGTEFLYGSPLHPAFPLQIYLDKWDQRDRHEPDDWTPAPHSWSNFCWPGIPPRSVPWAALKSAWRRSSAPSCMNCSGPMIVFQFGLWRATLLNLYPRFRYFCVGCKRCIEDDKLWEAEDWLRRNLEAETMPTHRRDLWGRLEPWQP